MRRFIGVLYGNAEPNTIGHCILAPHPQHAIAKSIYDALQPVVDGQGRLISPEPIHALTLSAAPQGGLTDVRHDSPAASPLGDEHDGPFGSVSFVHHYPPHFERETAAAMADRLAVGLQTGEVHLLALANTLRDDADPSLSSSVYDLIHKCGDHYRQQRSDPLPGLGELFARVPSESRPAESWQRCDSMQTAVRRHIVGFRNLAEFLRACDGLSKFVSGMNAVKAAHECDCHYRLVRGETEYAWRADPALVDPVFGPVVDVAWPLTREIYYYGMGSFLQPWERGYIERS